MGGIGALCLAAPYAWTHLFQDYQKNRILVIFDPTIDPQGLDERWHFAQSLRSLTGGGLSGQGLFQGSRTQVGALNAQHTDFIFSELTFGDGLLTATVEAVQPDGNRLIRFHYEGIFLEILDKLGTMPLPPYIKEKLDDPERYQTVYSKTPGSAAAPTAGLHFTTELLDALKAKGVKLAFVTLHVGLGTFRPVKEDEITDHIMHSEYYIMDEETAGIINDTRAAGGKIWAVGTTASRTLETIAADDGTVRAQSGWTDIFIYPGYKFKAVDHLVTNFHLPESTLMMLISAFATREMVMNAYQEAIKEEYRFFSFGDSMLLY